MPLKHLLLLAGLALGFPGAALAANPCGISPSDWCTTAADGECGRHPDAASCRADPACVGMTYTGESAIACHWDERGFADNCPTVGCLDRK